MGKVRFDISVSLDGFITGPNATPAMGLGEGGERLHEWLFGLESWRAPHGREGGESGPDAEVLEEAFGNLGAVVMGRNMFDVGEQPWGEDPPFHAPVFVVTHRGREPLAKQGGTTFTFVTDGVGSALEQAREAGGDKDVSIAGGANVIQQYLNAGLVDEFQVHIVPVMLAAGVRLFDHLDRQAIELEKVRVVDFSAVTHLKFRVVR